MPSLHLRPSPGTRLAVGRGSSVPKAGLLALCRSQQDVTEHSTTTPASSPEITTTRSRANFKANKVGKVPVVESQKPLAAYMALPASQYSVLDARRIERMDESTFRCYVGGLRFFSWSVEPVITVSVTVEDGGCTIRLLGCKLQGSRFIEDVNDKFSASMVNVVRYQEMGLPPSGFLSQAGGNEAVSACSVSPSRGSPVVHTPAETGPAAVASAFSASAPRQMEIVSTTAIEVCLEVPAWCSFLPVASIEAAGSSVVQNVLNAMVPRFLVQMAKDYGLWASGDESRRPVGEL